MLICSCNVDPLHPTFIEYGGIYRGRHIRYFERYFLIFALKHRLCVHLRIASRVPTIYVLSKNKKNIKNFQRKNVIFTALKIAVYCIDMFA